MEKYDNLNMCSGTEYCDLSGIIAELDSYMETGTYTKNKITSEQEYILSNVCPGYAKAKFGEILANIVNSIKDGEYIEELSEMQIANMNDMGCPAFEADKVLDILLDVIETHNSGTKKKDAHLDSLSVKNFEITPNFGRETYEYTLNVESTVDKVEVEATPFCEDATVTGTGETTLTTGENVIQVNVTAAEGGATKTYKITITKAA